MAGGRLERPSSPEGQQVGVGQPEGVEGEGGGDLAGEIKPKSSHKHGAAESFQKICSLFGGLMNHAKLLNWSLWQKIKT